MMNYDYCEEEIVHQADVSILDFLVEQSDELIADGLFQHEGASFHSIVVHSLVEYFQVLHLSIE